MNPSKRSDAVENTRNMHSVKLVHSASGILDA